LPERSSTAFDRCALPLVQRLAALLDLDPDGYREGDLLPRGWQAVLFAAPIPQRDLAADGCPLPPEGLGLERARLMHGGRRLAWSGDIVIGQRLRRVSHLSLSPPKAGRSGPLVRATWRHEVTAEDGGPALLTEEEDLIYLGAAAAASVTPAATPTAAARSAQHSMGFQPDEPLLFRFSAVTFNTHRIHYDLAYATGVEGYPALVVNGGLTLLSLVQFFRQVAGQPPASIAARNRRPLFCGRPATLKASEADGRWLLWAENEKGETAVEMEAVACAIP